MVENDRAGLFTEGTGGFLPGVPLLGHGPHLSTPAPQSAELTHRWEPRPLARPRSKSRDLREASSEASTRGSNAGRGGGVPARRTRLSDRHLAMHGQRRSGSKKSGSNHPRSAVSRDARGSNTAPHLTVFQLAAVLCRDLEKSTSLAGT